MKSILSVLMFAFSMFTGSTLAQTSTAPVQTPVPSVINLDWRGQWNVSIYEGGMLDSMNGWGDFRTSSIVVDFLRMTRNPDGSVYFDGEVSGMPGSWAGIFYNPTAEKYVELNFSFELPVVGGSGGRYSFQARVRMFADGTSSAFAGMMDGSFSERKSRIMSDGSTNYFQVPVDLYSGKVFMYRPGSGRG